MVHKQIKFVSLYLVLVATSAIAQSVTGTGTANTIPLFTGSSTLGNSSITQLNGNIGIDTVPTATLHVNSSYTSATSGLDSTQGFLWSNHTNFPTASFSSTDNRILTMTFDPTTGAPAIRSGSSAKLGFVGGGWYFSGGNVGIGTTSPGAPLEVNGNLKLTAGSGASITFPDATVQSTAWNGTLPGGDYAESIDVQGDRTTYEPGDVIVIDPTAPGKFVKSEKAYSNLVAGVFSSKPGLVGRRAIAARLDKEAEVPMAMMGIVPTKVSSENGAIKPGDLLVTASTPGYAMKGTNRDRLVGAVIGKALAPLNSGSGVIEVLISLQ